MLPDIDQLKNEIDLLKNALRLYEEDIYQSHSGHFESDDRALLVVVKQLQRVLNEHYQYQIKSINRLQQGHTG